MGRIEKSVEIKAPPEKVWAMCLFDRLPEWLDVIKSVEYTSEKRYDVGETAHIISEAAGVKVEFDVETTEYVENEKTSWRTTSGDTTAIGLATLKPTEKGTKLIFVMDYSLPYSLLGKLIDKLKVRRALEGSFERGFEKLKNTLER